MVQGNFVSKEQVEALKPGMSRQQVRDMLGTPLLTDCSTPTAGTMCSPSSARAWSRSRAS